MVFRQFFLQFSCNPSFNILRSYSPLVRSRDHHTKSGPQLNFSFYTYRDPDVHPQPETYWGNVNPIGPRACYDEGKRVSETLSYAYAKQENVNVRVARIFNTYGPRMHMNDGRVVSNFILQALQNESITVSTLQIFLICLKCCSVNRFTVMENKRALSNM